MAGDPGPANGGYRAVRRAVALGLAVVTGLIVVADSLQFGRQVDPIVLTTLVLAIAGLLAVDVPGLRR